MGAYKDERGEMMTYWRHVHHMNYFARCMADKHYSRQSIGSREFTPPGEKIVLLGENNDALWAVQRAAKSSGVIRADGYECWSNVIFRNESDELASDLITQALRICVSKWRDFPKDGLHTFIDPRHVKPTMRRGVKTWGYCYLKAGFEFTELTKVNKLMRFVLSAEKLATIEPLTVSHYKPRLFELEIAK